MSSEIKIYDCIFLNTMNFKFFHQNLKLGLGRYLLWNRVGNTTRQLGCVANFVSLAWPRLLISLFLCFAVDKIKTFQFDFLFAKMWKFRMNKKRAGNKRREMVMLTIQRNSLYGGDQFFWFKFCPISGFNSEMIKKWTARMCDVA